MLNARGHHRDRHTKASRHAAIFCWCSMPEGIIAIGTWRQGEHERHRPEVLNARGHHRDRHHGLRRQRRQPHQVLNARGHHRDRHVLDKLGAAQDLVCSTPEGIIAIGTTCTEPVRSERTGAQRPRASSRSAPTRSTSCTRPRWSAQRPRASSRSAPGRIVSIRTSRKFVCSTPEGIIAIGTQQHLVTGGQRERVLNARGHHRDRHPVRAGARRPAHGCAQRPRASSRSARGEVIVITKRGWWCSTPEGIIAIGTVGVVLGPLGRRVLNARGHHRDRHPPPKRSEDNPNRAERDDALGR